MRITPGNSQQQPTPPVPSRPMPPAKVPTQEPAVLPPEVQAHIVAWTDMQTENAKLRKLVADLNNELELQRGLVQQKDFLLQDERARFLECDRMKEKYLRYAQEILTNIGAGRDLIDKAHTRAMELAQKHEPKQPDEIDDEIKKAVQQMRETAQEPSEDTP